MTRDEYLKELSEEMLRQLTQVVDLDEYRSNHQTALTQFRLIGIKRYLANKERKEHNEKAIRWYKPTR